MNEEKEFTDIVEYLNEFYSDVETKLLEEGYKPDPIIYAVADLKHKHIERLKKGRCL